MLESRINLLCIFITLSLWLICLSKATQDFQDDSALVAKNWYDESSRKKTGHYFLCEYQKQAMQIRSVCVCRFYFLSKHFIAIIES